jgi:hypothetical protein
MYSILHMVYEHENVLTYNRVNMYCTLHTHIQLESLTGQSLLFLPGDSEHLDT